MKKKPHLSAISRLAIGLVLLTISIVLMATLIGVLPDHRRKILDGRAALSEAIAINSSYLASNGDAKGVQEQLRAIVQRNPDLLSAAFRRHDGRLLAEVGDHARHWTNQTSNSTATEIVVPVMMGREQEDRWSSVELRFRPISPGGLRGWIQHPTTRFILFLFPASLFFFTLYLRKMLRYLDPSKVVPNRVRTTLDTLAEGLLVLDDDGRIVHANQAFLDTVGTPVETLMGRRASELSWQQVDESQGEKEFPWTAAIRDGARQAGEMLRLKSPGAIRTFKVNSSPILGDNGEYRGALASFDDVTLIQKKQDELRRMLRQLEASRKEIHAQNQKLTLLATQDPLTSCLNRRSFFERFDAYWKIATQKEQDFCCVMLDIDHFKKINDNHGHSVGDEVLRTVSGALRDTSRENDLVCRFGGEEFCILLVGLNLSQGARVAERYREAVEKLEFPQLHVTISIGVTCNSRSAPDPQGLIDQADKALYEAKRTGRNRVVRWDELSEEARECGAESQSAAERNGETGAAENGDDSQEASIPFQAVNALVSALSYRDAATAEHVRRVADLCVALASNVLSARDTFIVESAALLHDIGKIGVPDSVLMKPGPLTEEEWRIMGIHDRIGTEIIRSTFDSPKLVEIITNYHAWYGGDPREDGSPRGSDIPIGARILAICDAFDSMVTDRVYRSGMTAEKALQELKRCAVQQFDPELVERFIELIESRDTGRASAEVSKTALIDFGTQMERLAEALELRDVPGLAALAGRLNQTALRHGATQIAEAAELLQGAAAAECDIAKLVKLTGDLLDLCGSVQQVFLEDSMVETANVE